MREGETDAERRLRAEDVWQTSYMSESNNSREGLFQDYERSTVEGSSTSFACGFLMGIVLGYIVIIWLAERSVSKQFKLGICSGIMVKLLYTMQLEDSTSSSGAT